MKTILFVVNQINYSVYNRYSAIDSILCSVLEQLSKNHIIYVNHQKFENTSSKADSKPIFKLSKASIIKKYIPKFIKKNFNDYKAIRSNKILFDDITRSVNPDVIIELMRYGSTLGVLLKNHYQKPLIAYFDSPAVEERQFFYPGFSFFDSKANENEETTIKMADQVIVYTQPIIEYWKQKIPTISSEKFNVFQTLDYSRLDFVDEKIFNQIPVIGFIGSFLKWHRLDLLLEAFEKVRQDGLLAKLLLIGAGEEYQYIMQKVQNSAYKEDITLTGFVDGNALKEYRKKIDVGVMPGTHWYCMPTKVFEYGAAQIPSIAPKTKNMLFLFKEGEHVLMFEQNNIDSLYKSIKEVLIQFKDKKKMGLALQKIVRENNSKEAALAFYMKLFN